MSIGGRIGSSWDSLTRWNSLIFGLWSEWLGISFNFLELWCRFWMRLSLRIWWYSSIRSFLSGLGLCWPGLLCWSICNIVIILIWWLLLWVNLMGICLCSWWEWCRSSWGLCFWGRRYFGSTANFKILVRLPLRYFHC